VKQAGGIEGVRQRSDSATLRHLISLQNTLSDGGEMLIPRIKAAAPLATSFPDTAFGRHLADVARVIRLELGIPVFKVALSGFDTHRNQRPTHARLLKVLAEGLMAFQAEMAAAGLWDRVALVSYSEFGRRAVPRAGPRARRTLS
jgi:uncharacterized protein (DUF1501 family)